MLNKKISTNILLIVCCLNVLFLTACQSNSAPKSNKVTSNERPLNVIRSHDGVQNLRWKILEIEGQKAQFIQQYPYIEMNATQQRVNGNTGCNPLFGKYQLNTQTMKIDLDVKAGHRSCHGALAQEAELMTALNEIQAYKLVGNRIQFYNSRGQMIMVGQK